MSGTITHSYTQGSVYGHNLFGSLVGSNIRGTITNSSSAASMTGDIRKFAGLIGIRPNGSIIDSYWSIDTFDVWDIIGSEK